MSKNSLTRSVIIPDYRRVALYERSPDLGPSVLFFSGGTAMNDISRDLKGYTHQSVHMMTPFDSGGSSAVLRKAFDMPAVGDMRSRIMALADEGLTRRPEIVALFAHRLDRNGRKKDLRTRLDAMAAGKDPLVAAVKNPTRRAIRKYLQTFVDVMPEDFDLAGGCIGNLILAAGYLSNDRNIDQVTASFSKLVNLRGRVLPIVDVNMQLVARLEDGREIVGQHKFTGKEEGPIDSPVRDLWLTRDQAGKKKAQADLSRRNRKIIQEADLICYAPGSFWSSLCANLLPQGCLDAVAANRSAKVFVPGLGEDPEMPGLDTGDKIRQLVEFLQKQRKDTGAVSDLLTHVLIDPDVSTGVGKGCRQFLQKHQIQFVQTSLVSADDPARYDPRRFNPAILSLV